MAIRYGYFNSVDGDRKYNAEDMTMYFKGLVSDGVFQTIGNMFVVTAGTGLTVNVGTGRALVNMHWVENTAITSLDLGVGSVSADTYKIIVLRCDLTDSVRSVALMVRSMEDESVRLVNTEYITELCLARVRIRKNSSTISQSDIRDYRGSTYCPWITGLIKQVDVATLTGQFYRFYEEQTKELEEYMTTQKESFNNWLASLQGELRVDTKLKNYQSTYTTTGTNTSEIPLVTNYETGDILTVHMNGLSLIEGTEYTLDTENQKIILTNPVKSGNIITQVLTKSVIGSSGDSGDNTTKAKIPNGTDLNTIKTTGLYHADTVNLCTNGPETGKITDAFGLIVTGGADCVTQLFIRGFGGAGNSVFFRTGDITDPEDWNPWQRLAEAWESPTSDTYKVYYNPDVCEYSDLSVSGMMVNKNTKKGVFTLSGSFVFKSGTTLGTGLVICQTVYNSDKSKIYNSYTPDAAVYAPIYSDSGIAGMAVLQTTGNLTVLSVGDLTAGQKYHVSITCNFE